MLNPLLRICLLLALCTGFVLPKMGAVLANAIPGIQTLVICTGAELVTVTLNAAGEPIDVAESNAQDCLRADLPPDAHRLMPVWQRLARAYSPPFAVLENPSALRTALALQRPSHAPPVVL